MQRQATSALGVDVRRLHVGNGLPTSVGRYPRHQEVGVVGADQGERAEERDQQRHPQDEDPPQRVVCADHVAEGVVDRFVELGVRVAGKHPHDHENSSRAAVDHTVFVIHRAQCTTRHAFLLLSGLDFPGFSRLYPKIKFDYIILSFLL